MNFISFRRYLEEKDRKCETIYKPVTLSIQKGESLNESALWADKNIVNVSNPVDLRLANVVFPSRVHLLATSIFYDRIYVHLNDFTDDYVRIEDPESFKSAYQMLPTDFLALVRKQRVVPILKLGMSTYPDYMSKEILFPIITNELPYLTFEGHALICQIWQFKNNSFPDPKDSTWGFLMDLCGAMGIGASLVRPEFDLNWWDKRDLIFDSLSVDEVARHFQSRDLPLRDFFIATGIDYDSSVPVEEYLSAFDHIDRDRLYALYTKMDKVTFYDEMKKINALSRQVSKKIDQHHRHRQVLSIGIIFLWCALREWLGNLFAGPVADGVERLADEQLAGVLKKARTKFLDFYTTRWEKHQHWLHESGFPEVLELVKLQKILKLNK